MNRGVLDNNLNNDVLKHPLEYFNRFPDISWKHLSQMYSHITPKKSLKCSRSNTLSIPNACVSCVPGISSSVFRK